MVLKFWKLKNRMVFVPAGDQECACSGTHVKNCKELQGIKITSIKIKKEIVHVSYEM